ncbi:MAG TPA: hypothetical protein PK880_05850 [Candidatus Competibacter sp.]|nr:hypothetical protein [Candidatus Competibacteraceae bacterium]HRC72041.1 hypothetical protein [Candidatus Competibacter sp.]
MALQLRVKWSLAAVIGSIAICAGSSKAADSDGLLSPSPAHTEVASVVLKANPPNAGATSAPAHKANSDGYDPYTCAAAYGDAFCADFERCTSTYGFDACYRRFNRQTR